MTTVYTRFNDKHLFKANFTLSKDKVSGTANFQKKKVFKPVFVETITPTETRNGEASSDQFMKEVSITTGGIIINSIIRNPQIVVENPQDAVIFHTGFGVNIIFITPEALATATYVDPYDDPYAGW